MAPTYYPNEDEWMQQRLHYIHPAITMAADITDSLRHDFLDGPCTATQTAKIQSRTYPYSQHESTGTYRHMGSYPIELHYSFSIVDAYHFRKEDIAHIQKSKENEAKLNLFNELLKNGVIKLDVDTERNAYRNEVITQYKLTIFNDTAPKPKHDSSGYYPYLP